MQTGNRIIYIGNGVYANLCKITRICARLRETARVYASLREFTRNCASLRESARVYASLHVYKGRVARVCFSPTVTTEVGGHT